MSPRSPKANARTARREERRTPTRGNREVYSDEPVAPKRPKKEPVKPLTDNQARYDSAIRSQRIIFGIGPAGTGKTWYAVMMACEALENKQISQIIITRPAVEAEEELGFLPGLMEEKFEPYIRPLRDAFNEKLGTGQTEYLLKNKVIEARPLAYLRGSTLKDAIVILDEAQNMTPGQMKMFLSRIGSNATFIINGDPTQKDISGPCGLLDGIDAVRDIGGVAVIRFTSDDIVRDDICMDVIKAYERRKMEQQG